MNPPPIKNRSWVVTGAGLVSAAGDSPAALFETLCRAQTLVGSVDGAGAYETGISSGGILAAPIQGFDPKAYIQRKGLKHLSRTSQLACAGAARIAGAVSGLPAPEIGVALGSAWGSLKTVIDFERAAHLDGPRLVDPLLFTETVSNVPAGQISIFNGWSAFNITVSSGPASGLEAIRCAIDFLEEGRASTAIAGGADEINLPLLRSLAAQGRLAASLGVVMNRASEAGAAGEVLPRVLAGAAGAAGAAARPAAAGGAAGSEESRGSFPFDVHRRGPSGGEGACLVAIEERGRAVGRGAVPLALIRACAGRFGRTSLPGDTGMGLTALIVDFVRDLLDSAALAAKDLDLLVLSGNGSIEADLAEARGMIELFGAGSGAPAAVAPKAILGETWGASGPFGLVAALEAIRTGVVPGLARGAVIDAEAAGLNFPTGTLSRTIRHALVLECGGSGHLSGLVVSAA